MREHVARDKPVALPISLSENASSLDAISRRNRGANRNRVGYPGGQRILNSRVVQARYDAVQTGDRNVSRHLTFGS
jgi:hypothetical protein